jgi:hypothetical protein
MQEDHTNSQIITSFEKDIFIEKIINNREDFIKALHCINYIKRSICSAGKIGVSLNSLPAVFVDKFISKACQGEYVDKFGFDIISNILPEPKKISNKSQQVMFRGKSCKSSNFILYNKLSPIENVGYSDIDYDYILMIQTKGNFGVSICRKEHIIDLIKVTPTASYLQVPNSRMFFIVDPLDGINYENSGYVTETDYTVYIGNIGDIFFGGVSAIWDGTKKHNH